MFLHWWRKTHLFLRDYLHRHWIDEFLSEAKSATQSPTEMSHQSIKYLELYWPWAYDLETQSYTCSLRLDLCRLRKMSKSELENEYCRARHNH